jgi:hypothetical protein
LDVAYGQSDLGNHVDPVDELIHILLSTMMTETNYQRLHTYTYRVTVCLELIR